MYRQTILMNGKTSISEYTINYCPSYHLYLPIYFGIMRLQLQRLLSPSTLLFQNKCKHSKFTCKHGSILFVHLIVCFAISLPLEVTFWNSSQLFAWNLTCVIIWVICSDMDCSEPKIVVFRIFKWPVTSIKNL